MTRSGFLSRLMWIRKMDTDIIPALGEEVKKANPNIECLVPPYCFIIYHDGEYKDKDIDIEYCEAVTAFGKDTGGIVFKKVDRIPEAACLYHKGPYGTFGFSYAYLFKWIEDNNYTPVGPPRESYIDGIWNKKDENDWLTELQVPVMKKK